MRPLNELEPCFQGIIPSYLATVSAEGEPNIAAVSIVHLLGPQRVGVSCQFMNKTLANLRETGRAQLQMLHPVTLGEYLLDLRFERIIDEGPVFERMDATLEAVASQSNMAGTFSLAGVAEFEVLAWRKATPELDDAVAPRSERSPVDRLARISAVIASASDVDALFDQTFAVLAEELSLRHGFLLLADGAGEKLYNVASHGFEPARFGAEIAVGEGLYGTAAARRTTIRTGSMRRERIMLQAVARESARPDPTYLPLPGLPNVESSLAVPLVRNDRCIGVLCFQSAAPGAFGESCEKVLGVVAHQLAAMIALLGVGSKDVELSARRGPVGTRALALRVKYFESDGSIFLDDEYLIKGVAGRILFRLLSAFVNEQRNSFSNKEIRLDPEVGLPAFRDNLESRLISLQKRLHEHTTALRIEKTARGRFRLDVSREVVLERKA